MNEENSLKLYNTMSRKKDDFRPRSGNSVKVFTCGPSIYRRPHIGNYRTFLYEDILVKYLEYKGYTVERVINFTDVEDKAIEEAVKMHMDIEKLTGEAADHFFEEAKLLNIKLPSEIPGAATSIDQAVKMIQALIDKGAAYRYRGNIFFDPLKHKNFGKLFRLDMSTWPKHTVRFKRDTYNGRRWNRGDFILWHGYKEGDTVYWDTEIGRGRPSWNIQDPAIITKYLGEAIDINCGGIDNIFRHHDYNIAIMETYSGVPFANYYLHGEHLIVDGKTMSKSRGNILYPQDVLKNGYNPRHLRFSLLYKHYREKLNFTAGFMKRTSEILDEFATLYTGIKKAAVDRQKGDPALDALIERIPKVFEANMDDDLSLGKAFDSVCDVLKTIQKESLTKRLSASQASRIETHMKRIDSVLGITP